MSMQQMKNFCSGLTSTVSILTVWSIDSARFKKINFSTKRCNSALRTACLRKPRSMIAVTSTLLTNLDSKIIKKSKQRSIVFSKLIFRARTSRALHSSRSGISLLRLDQTTRKLCRKLSKKSKKKIIIRKSRQNSKSMKTWMQLRKWASWVANCTMLNGGSPIQYWARH